MVSERSCSCKTYFGVSFSINSNRLRLLDCGKAFMRRSRLLIELIEAERGVLERRDIDGRHSLSCVGGFRRQKVLFSLRGQTRLEEASQKA